MDLIVEPIRCRGGVSSSDVMMQKPIMRGADEASLAEPAQPIDLVLVRRDLAPIFAASPSEIKTNVTECRIAARKLSLVSTTERESRPGSGRGVSAKRSRLRGTDSATAQARDQQRIKHLVRLGRQVVSVEEPQTFPEDLRPPSTNSTAETTRMGFQLQV